MKRSERVEADSSIYEFKRTVKLSAAPMTVSAGANEIYVLMNNNKIARVDVNTFSVTYEFEIKDYDATSLSFSSA